MLAGTLRYGNGDVYEGAFKEGKRHGQGTLTFADGDDYTGAWFDDLQQANPNPNPNPNPNLTLTLP